MIREIGDRLTLVGVAHVLPKSIEEVEEAIVEKNPETVGVELCPSRYFQLTTDTEVEKDIPSGFSREVLVAKVLRFFQEEIGKETGMLPGEEMLTAVDTAQEVGAEVKLIDRDINLTLQRLLDKMSFWEKIKILSEILFSFFWVGEEINLEDLTEEEVVEELLSNFRDFSESAYSVLIEERNEYMAKKIIELLSLNTGEILCVVGAGHIPGLSEKLESRLEGEALEDWYSLQMDWGS